MRQIRPSRRVAVGLVLTALSCATKPEPKVAEVGGAPRAAALATVGKTSAEPALSTADARHLLDRFAFGPRPGDVNALQESGARAWFRHQLRADELPDPRAERAVLPYRRALAPPEDLPELFAKGGVAIAIPTGESRGKMSRALMEQTSTRQLLRELQMVEIVRHLESEHQLREVMVHFWTNHFSVYARKGEISLLAGDYVERVIRPAALGRFEDLLLATARHPAMLRYLDNASSRAKPTHGQKGLPGITENYARELLELHTLGVDGGYDQLDVIAVARILTGWTFRAGAEGRGYTFGFEPRIHDRGRKLVMGVEFPAGKNEEEGVTLLHLLASHRSTARHLASKLCIRFVADEPPEECVEVTQAAFLASGGDIKLTLQALLESRSFWAPENRKNKLKTPLEFLLSAVRGLDARLAGTTELARVAARLGEAPFGELSPTGRVEDSQYWLKSFTLARLGFAEDVAFGRVPGVVLDGHAALDGSADPKIITKGLSETLLLGVATSQTCTVIEQALSETSTETQRYPSGVALALSSPEFQWR